MIGRSVIIIFIIIAFLAMGAIAAPIVVSGLKVQGAVRHGNRYLELGNYNEAISSFEAALRVSSKRLDAEIGLAKAYEAEGKFIEAEKSLKDAININNKDPKPYIELAELYLEKGMLKDAIVLLKDGYEKTRNKTIKKMLDNLEPDTAPSTSQIKSPFPLVKRERTFFDSV